MKLQIQIKEIEAEWPQLSLGFGETRESRAQTQSPTWRIMGLSQYSYKYRSWSYIYKYSYLMHNPSY